MTTRGGRRTRIGWAVVNAIVPITLAIAVLLTAGSHPEASLALWKLLGAGCLTLAVANLVALPFRWRRRGPRALLAPGALVLAFLLALAINFYGFGFALSGTPARPATYFDATRRAELEEVASRLLAGERDPRTNTILQREGFREVEVDSALGIVLLRHLRDRASFEYSWVPGGWPPDFTRAPRAPGLAARFRSYRDGAPGPLTDPRVTCADGSNQLLLDGLAAGIPSWAQVLFVTLLDRGVVSRAADARHLTIRAALSETERGELAWVQLALDGVLQPARALPDHVFDRPLAPRWYFRAN